MGLPGWGRGRRAALSAAALLAAALATGCGSGAKDATSSGPPSAGHATGQGGAASEEASVPVPGEDSGSTEDAAPASSEDASSGIDGSHGGDSGAAGPDAGAPPAFVATGAPITGTDGAWTWVDFPDSFCRDGSTAGIAVNLESASRQVMIFIQGGGACFDSLTCAINPANTSGQQTPSAAGVFDRTNSANPVAAWNFVYVPYCTGDIGAGANPNGSVSGVTGTQMFVGYPNMEAFLNRVVPTFPNASQVLLTGVSAGGFGAAVDFPLVQRAFPSVKVSLVDDSGPPMSDTYLPTCLQQEWATTWGFKDSLLLECGSECPDPTDYVMDYAKFLGRHYSDRMVGLLDSDTDSIISAFYGYGTSNCTGSLLTPIPGATYTAGLEDFRSEIMPIDPSFGTYFPDSSQHTWIADSSLYSETQGGVTLISWLSNIVNDVSVAQVGP